jgi:hypothetical protein
MGSETEQLAYQKKAIPPTVAFRAKSRPPISAYQREKTDGAVRGANMLPAPTRVNSRRLDFMYLLLRYWWDTAVDWKRTIWPALILSSKPRRPTSSDSIVVRPTCCGVLR